MSKNKTFEWSDDHQIAFETLKGKFLTEPVLMIPDQTKPFEIECDASAYASGAVLLQQDSNGARHPVAYYSRAFNQAERNYHCSEQELLAIIRALNEWRYYLEGSPHATIVWSDHENLKRWRKPQDLNRRQARWTAYLQRFNITIKHLPGKKNGPADALSRRPDHVPAEKDNQDITILSKEVFSEELQIIDEATKNRIKTSHIPKLTSYTTDQEGFLRENGKLVIPDDLDLRRQLTPASTRSPNRRTPWNH